MKIAFIFPPFSHKKFEEDIDVVSREFTQPPPLGLAYAAAIAEKAGHQACIIDANCRPRLTKKTVLNKINTFKSHALGFMLTAYMFRETLDWIEFLKKETNLPVIVGNILTEMYPEEILSHSAIDYGIIGSAQNVLPSLLSSFEKNEANFTKIEGLCYKSNGEIIIQRPPTLEENFDTLPFPARHLLDNSKYSTIISKRKNFTIMITSKGCLSKCGFCYIQNIPYSCRKVSQVLNEIDEAYTKYNIREIEFFDPIFTYNKKRVLEICYGIIERGYDISWACRARIDQVDEEILTAMKQAGCVRIYYGIECGNQSMLNQIQKGTTLEQIKSVMLMTKQKKILTLGFFIFGIHGETVKTINETINFALSLKLNYAQFHKAVAKPGSKLADEVIAATGRDYWREYIKGSAEEERLPTPWTTVSAQELEKLTVKAYRKFYFNLARLLKITLGIKSFDEFFRYCRSAVGLFTVKSDCVNT